MIGKNDSHPVSTGGRVLALLWMIASLFIVSSLTAVITSALTVNELQSNIESLSDLKRARVVTVTGSSSEDFLRENRIGFAAEATLEDVLIQVAAGEADAALYDRPLLKYTINERFANELSVLPLVLAPQSYGIATVQDSDRLEAINRSLLTYIGLDNWQEELSGYLGEE